MHKYTESYKVSQTEHERRTNLKHKYIIDTLQEHISIDIMQSFWVERRFLLSIWWAMYCYLCLSGIAEHLQRFPSTPLVAAPPEWEALSRPCPEAGLGC